MLECKAINNTIKVNVKLNESSDSPLVNKGRY
jgi:hypothetical protein